MYIKVKKIAAVILCVVMCMTTHVDITAAIETPSDQVTESEELITETAEYKETETVEASETLGHEEIVETSETLEEETEPDTTEAQEDEKTESDTTEVPEEEETEPDTTEVPEDEETTYEAAETGSVIETENEEMISEITEMSKDFLSPYGPGYIEEEYDAEQLSQSHMRLFAAEHTLPTYYSAVENGQVTSVKNQASWGSCWAFAAVATAESGYKKITGTETDLSETHLINFLYNEDLSGPDGGLEGDRVIPSTSKVNNGGNGMYTTFAMARWTGVADEEADESLVYPTPEKTKETTELNISQDLAYNDLVHMQNAYWININDRDAVKKAVMEYGTVLLSYKDDEMYSSRNVNKSIYNGPTVYYNYDNFCGTSHAVSLVGWDDDFDKNQFNYIYNNIGVKPHLPLNNGAWLIKNSWGVGDGDDGYFWISYEDVSISNTIYAFVYEKADNYDHIYQYDGSVGARYETGDTITAAGIYQSTGNQLIEAVGVGIASAETDYTVELYTGLADRNDPQSGRLSASVTGKTIFQGYHTIEFEKYVPVAEGDMFSVVITLSGGRINDEDGAAIFMDQTYNNGSAVKFIAKANPGETFSKDGDVWYDAAQKGTYRIKAYTSDGEFAIPEGNRILTLEMLKEIGEQEYNCAGNEPVIEMNYMGEQLVRDVDYSVVYINNDKVAEKTSQDAPTAIITGIGKYTGTIEQAFTIVPKQITDDMAGLPVYGYSGAVQDDVEVRDGEHLLVKETDYSVSYDRQPLRAGTYTATIRGLHNYIGEIQIPVVITKVTITPDMIMLPEYIEYTGKAVRPEVKVMINNTQMTSADFSVSYKNNTNVGKTAEVIIAGKGDCQGKVTINFEICPKNIAEGVTVSNVKAVYTGKQLQPSVKVKHGNLTLKKGRDYIVEYMNNINACTINTDVGTPMVAVPTVRIIGTGNYTGSYEKEFSIFPKEIAESSLSVQISCDDNDSASVQVFAGKTELNSSPGAEEVQIKITQAGSGIEADNIVLGEKYDIQITLVGNYKIKGKISVLKKNIICKKDIDSLNIKLADKNSVYTYNGKAQRPKLEVRDANGNMVSSSCYTITYADNINAGGNTDQGIDISGPRVIVRGRGDYAGTKQIGFVIQKQQLDSLTVSSVKDYVYTGKAITPAVKVKNGKKTLKAGVGKDYICSYSNNVDVAYDENGSATAGACIQIHFSGNYEIPNVDENAMKVYFRILPAKITAVTLSSAYYTGERVQPENIVVKAGKLVVPQDCYEIATSNDIAVSAKAQLTVMAYAGTNYTGNKAKKYRITKQELKKLVMPIIPDQPYLGKSVDISSYVIKQQNGEAIGAEQYDITVKNNRKPGKATVTYKAKSDGLYKGSATVRFNITQATMAQAIDYEAAQTITKTYTGESITLSEEELRKLAPIKEAPDEYQLPYTVTYSRNVNAGKAAVRLEGNDYLHGTKTMYFTITPKSASAFAITTGPKNLNYSNGEPVYLEITSVIDKDSGEVLYVGKDYTYSYVNADKKGTACLTITGVGNYSGTRYIYYNIV